MIPKSMYKQKQVRSVVQAAAPSTRVLPVSQLNATVVNTHLKKHAGRAKELEEELAGTMLAGWTKHVAGFREGYLYRYYADLELILRDWSQDGKSKSLH